MKDFHSPYSLIISIACITIGSFASGQDKAPVKPDFMTQVKPLIEGACIHCHNPEKADKDGGEYDMTTRKAAFAGGAAYGEDVINTEDANDSPVYWMTTVHLDDPDDPEAMPPERPLNEKQQQVFLDWIATGAEWPDDVVLVEKPRVTFAGIRPLLMRGGPFRKSEIETLKYWIEQGADWPKGVVLGGPDGGPGDNLDLTKEIHALIAKTTTEKAESDMKDYKNKIPETGVEYEMVAIKGGEFTMGSPDDESMRNADEGPQRKITIEPFWMGKFEVTWDMYEPFMITDVARNKDGSPETIPPDAEPPFIVSKPTTPYQEMSFGMGNTEGFPAICMTQHAANKFCQWLSAQTGHYYRLPTEAEWEYACRAGTTGPFHCKEEDLDQYAVFDPTQTRTGYEKVGTKKPNPWGLHDMHGNLLEWCLDQHNEQGYTEEVFVKPTKLYPRVARGGSWYDTADLLRSAARTASHEDWKQQDPQLPKSIWYHTDATWLGFRLVRPLAVPAAEEMHELWNIGTKDEE